MAACSLSIVTPIYSARPDAVEMLEALYFEGLLRHCPESAEIILIDDASPLRAETEAAVRRMERRRRIMFLSNGSNQGFVKSTNRGLRAATGDLILMANSDIRLTEGALAKLTAALDAPQTGAAGPVSNNAGSYSPQQVDGFKPLTSYSSLELERIDRYAQTVRSRLSGHWEVPWLMGFCLLFKRAALAKVGFLDEKFGLGYFEELDFCLRLGAAGYRLSVQRGAFVFHGGVAQSPYSRWGWSSQSMNSKQSEVDQAVYRNMNYINEKHGKNRLTAVRESYRHLVNPPIEEAAS